MTDAEALSTREHPHLGVLFERARRLLYAAIIARFRAEGFDDVREGHGSVFVFMRPGGTRLTELARRARMTKQSMGELVRDLEALGYVERRPDPDDGRAKIVVFTPSGERVNAIGIEAITDMERQWARSLGRQRMEALRAALEELTANAPGEATHG
jgi:DNA-binding MarR family transcriptional regulator